jgi:hypothetical protein
MTDEEERLEARLGTLLHGAERAPDAAFVARVERAVAAEQRMEAQRRAAWRRLGSEATAAGAVAAAFLLLGRLAPATGEVDLLAFGPAMAAGLSLLLWMGVGMRPFATGR